MNIKFVKSDLSETNLKKVICFFYKKQNDFTLAPSGGRSVIIDDYLKIKGCGQTNNNYNIDFSNIKNQKELPHIFNFDFSGNKTINKASCHYYAPKGGMSFQQASTEYSIYNRIKNNNDKNLDALKCLAWGYVEDTNKNKSYFSVHKFDFLKREIDRIAPIEKIYKLAFDYGLVGFFSCYNSENKSIMHDLHPFIELSEINDSAISATFKLITALNIQFLAIKCFVDIERAKLLYKFLDKTISDKDVELFREKIVIPLVTSDFNNGEVKNLEIIKSSKIAQIIYEIFSQKYSSF